MPVDFIGTDKPKHIAFVIYNTKSKTYYCPGYGYPKCKGPFSRAYKFKHSFDAIWYLYEHDIIVVVCKSFSGQWKLLRGKD